MPASRPPRPAPTSVEVAAVLAEVDRLSADVATALANTGSTTVPPLVTPDDYGFTAWTMDPLQGTTTGVYTAGTMFFARVKMPKAAAINNVIVPLTGAGAGLTGAWVGVYSLAGVQLGVSADQSASWGTAGTKTVPLTAPTASQAAGTTVLVAVLTTGTTGPSGRFAPSAATINQNIANTSGYRVGQLAAQTALPSPLPLASTTSGASMPLLFLT